MTIQTDLQYQHRLHLSQAIATIEIELRLGNLPYFGWIIMKHAKQHLLREYERSR